MSTVLKGLLDDYVPADLGFDGEQFPEYRDVQLEALEFATYSDKRFIGIGAPTGVGKQLLAASLWKLTGMRTAILTCTLGLQEAYRKNYGRYGLKDIQGQRNYQCKSSEFKNMSCRDAMRLGCGECGQAEHTYGWAKGRARESSGVSTNYDYWMWAQARGQGLERSGVEKEINGENPFELLILDEATQAEKKLSGHLHLTIREKEIEQAFEVESVGDKLEEWRGVARECRRELDAQIRTYKMEMEALMRRGNKLKELVEVSRELEKLKEQDEKFERVVGMQDKEWVIEKHEHVKYGVSWTFDVVRPGKYFEKYIFNNIPKVVLMDAALRPKHMRLMGIGSEVSEFREWRRVFKPERGPILHLPPMKVNEKGEPVMININRHIKDSDLDVWVSLIDDVIEEWAVRGGYKGLVHSVSYERQSYLIKHSRHSKLMIGNTKDVDSPSAWEAFEKHCNRDGPSVLVSPSFSTGWDFEGDRARWQIIAKVPFVPRVGKLMQARLNQDSQYADQLTMTELMQSAGRVVRGEDDWAVTLIVDGALTYFMTRNKQLAPSWFSQAIRRVGEVPRARRLV